MVLRALASARLADFDLTYRIVGTGTDLQRLQHLAAELGVSNRVTFVGEVADRQLEEEYEKADLFVLATRGDGEERVEGFGLVFVEALAHGVPVIGGRVGGVPEAVRHGVDGLLVDPRDPAALATAIADLLADPQQANEMARRGRERALAELSTRAMGQRFLDAVRGASSDQPGDG